jgi:hypothetical protein
LFTLADFASWEGLGIELEYKGLGLDLSNENLGCLLGETSGFVDLLFPPD